MWYPTNPTAHSKEASNISFEGTPSNLPATKNITGTNTHGPNSVKTSFKAVNNSIITQPNSVMEKYYLWL
jgi:hypothetical protein